MEHKDSLNQQYESAHGLVQYRVIGDGEPLVMVHGTPWSSYTWREIAPKLAETHRVHLYDLPGYGRSEKYDGQDVSLGIQNEVLADLSEHWGLDSSSVVCHDIGGATVLRTTLLNDVRFRRIALLDAVALRPWGSPFYEHVREHEGAFATAPTYIHRAILREHIRGALYREASDDEINPCVEPWIGEMGQPAFYRQIAQNGQRYTDEVEERYDEVDVPVLILWGEQDEWLPIETGRRLHDRLPTSEFRSIPDAGHLIQEDATETVVQTLYDFMEGPSPRWTPTVSQ